MPQPYNLTNMTSSSNLYELTKATNDLAAGGIGFILYFGTFIVAYFSFAAFGGKRAFAGASFITSIISILLNVLGFISPIWMYAMFLMVGVSIAWLRWS